MLPPRLEALSQLRGSAFSRNHFIPQEREHQFPASHPASPPACLPSTESWTVEGDPQAPRAYVVQSYRCSQARFLSPSNKHRYVNKSEWLPSAGLPALPSQPTSLFISCARGQLGSSWRRWGQEGAERGEQPGAWHVGKDVRLCGLHLCPCTQTHTASQRTHMHTHTHRHAAQQRWCPSAL